MIDVTEHIVIDEKELSFSFIRSSGPGGQNVNKVSTAVQLKFDVIHSSLPETVKERLQQQSGNRINRDGILMIHCNRFRSQEQNRRDAVNRLRALIRKATIKPQRRIKTKPSKSAIEERLQLKHHRGGVKKLRQTKPDPDSE